MYLPLVSITLHGQVYLYLEPCKNVIREKIPTLTLLLHQQTSVKVVQLCQIIQGIEAQATTNCTVKIKPTCCGGSKLLLVPIP